MSEKESNPVQHYTGVRPPALTLICVLTFFWSSLSAFGSLLVFLLFNDLDTIIQQSSFPDQEKELVKMLQNADRSFFLIISALNISSLTGAILMWKLRKSGFHFYTISQLLILTVPFFLLTGYSISLSNAIITAVFIAAYAVNLPQMR